MNYTSYKLSDVGRVVTGKTPSTKVESYFSTDKNKYLFITPRDMNIDSKYITATERYLTDEVTTSFKNIVIDEKSVCVSCIGTVGKVFIPSQISITNQQINSITQIKDFCDYNYLYYYLKLNHKKIQAIAGGTTMPIVNKSSFENIEIELPELKIQKQISKLLNDIDNKIELNNYIKNNLFEISNSIYIKFLNNISGKEECCFKDLKELGKVVMGQSPKGESYNYDNDGLPLINGAADYENGYLKAQKYTSKPIKKCGYGDLLFCIRATIGLLVICDKEYCLGRGVAGIIDINPVYKEYSYFVINSSIEEFKRMATGSVIVGISRDNIENLLVKIPSKEEINNFHEIQKPIFDEIEQLRLENEELKELRDTLLPKLLSGEINVENIEI